MTHVIELDECQRQLTLLALAQLSLERPGFYHALLETARKVPGGERMYEEYRRINRDGQMEAHP